MERTFLVIIIFIGLGMAVLMSAINGTWQATSFSDYHDDAEIYNRTALAILEQHSFSDDESGFVGAFRRAPGYSLFLAFSYGFLGKTPISAFVTQGVLFISSILLLWSLAARLFPYPARLLPSLLFSLSWFIPLQITKLGTELLSLFLLLFFLWSLNRFMDYRRSGYLLGAGTALAWFMLIKPIALYILPFLLAIVIAHEYKRVSPRQLGLNLGLLLLVPLIALSAWTIRSVALFNTWQIQSGSYVVAWKSLEIAAPWRRVAASFTAALVSDIVADKIMPGYADNPDPYLYVDAVFDHMRALRAQGVSEKEREAVLYKEARERIVANPLKFFIAGITGVLRQNTPMNHRGEAITHLFAGGGYHTLSSSQKITIVVILRLAWYFLLFLVAWGIALHYKQWRAWGIVIVWVLFYNLFYGFFTHNEARYMIPVLPLYLLLLTSAIIIIYEHYAKRLRTPLS